MQRCTWLLLLLAAAGWNGRVDALTIYRIGGADLPPPELAVAYEFVQLEWEAVDTKMHGGTVQMALTPEAIALSWDGVLASGETPAPGLYLLRLEVDSDQGKEALQRVVSLAY